jgi:hypothetical protein
MLLLAGRSIQGVVWLIFIDFYGNVASAFLIRFKGSRARLQSQASSRSQITVAASVTMAR